MGVCPLALRKVARIVCAGTAGDLDRNPRVSCGEKILQPQQTSTAVFRLKSLAGEVQSDSGEVAANAVECAPEV